jgi:hypothetical protein
MTFYWNTDLADESQIKIRMNPLNLCHLCSKNAKLVFCYVLRKNSTQLFSIECVFQLYFKQKRHFEMHPIIKSTVSKGNIDYDGKNVLAYTSIV